MELTPIDDKFMEIARMGMYPQINAMLAMIRKGMYVDDHNRNSGKYPSHLAIMEGGGRQLFIVAIFEGVPHCLNQLYIDGDFVHLSPTSVGGNIFPIDGRSALEAIDQYNMEREERKPTRFLEKILEVFKVF